MSPHQMAALGIRLFAIWLAIYCARWAPYLFGVARETDETGIVVVTVLAALLSIAAVLILWFFPRTIARTILPAGDSHTAANGTPETWLTIGCALLGLWVLAEAVPMLLQTIYAFAYAKRANFPLANDWGASLVYALAELAIGVWLVLGGNGVHKLIRWARSR